MNIWRAILRYFNMPEGWYRWVTTDCTVCKGSGINPAKRRETCCLCCQGTGKIEVPELF